MLNNVVVIFITLVITTFAVLYNILTIKQVQVNDDSSLGVLLVYTGVSLALLLLAWVLEIVILCVPTLKRSWIALGLVAVLLLVGTVLLFISASQVLTKIEGVYNMATNAGVFSLIGTLLMVTVLVLSFTYKRSVSFSMPPQSAIQPMKDLLRTMTSYYSNDRKQLDRLNFTIDQYDRLQPEQFRQVQSTYQPLLDVREKLVKHMNKNRERIMQLNKELTT